MVYLFNGVFEIHPESRSSSIIQYSEYFNEYRDENILFKFSSIEKGQNTIDIPRGVSTV